MSDRLGKTKRFLRWAGIFLVLLLAVECLVGWRAYRSNAELTRQALRGDSPFSIPALYRLGSRDDGSALDADIARSIFAEADLETRVFLQWFGAERSWWSPSAVLDTVEGKQTRRAVSLLTSRDRRLDNLAAILRAREHVKALDRGAP